MPAVVFLGDSLTAGYGLDPDQAYPALIQRKIDEAGLRYRVVNAGVSGETSAGARRRVEWLLSPPVAVVVVETGGNDGLRGQDPGATAANIQAIIDRVRSQPSPPKVVLMGLHEAYRALIASCASRLLTEPCVQLRQHLHDRGSPTAAPKGVPCRD